MSRKRASLIPRIGMPARFVRDMVLQDDEQVVIVDGRYTVPGMWAGRFSDALAHEREQTIPYIQSVLEVLKTRHG